ncbi:hypothetical protein PG997_010842 [Apiospora hydei]|uniref:Fungal N-terminal domain-containing protein n=1 Tax=Apiospora hydei TaxID=1337664 RepID=A0ABR1VL23_9PEZI
MDPLSLAASVVGLASFGLQVSGGISTYLDALKCREGELEAIRRQNAALRNTLAAIEATSTTIQHLSPRAAAAAAQTISSCADDLSALELFVAHLSESDLSTWRLRLKGKARKLHYVFDRPKINQLHTRIAQSKAALQLAVGQLELTINRVNMDMLSSVDSTLHDNSTEVFLVRSELGHAHQTIQSSFELQQGFQERFDGIESSLQTLLAACERAPCMTGDGKSLTRAAALLAAKPAALKEVCNFNQSGCICRRRVQTQLEYSNFGSYYQVYTEDTKEGHSPYCPLYRITATKRRRKYGLRLTGLTHVLKAAVEISFSVSSGAGGRSISPQFTYYPTVDTRMDPAFRVIFCLREVIRQNRCHPSFYPALERKAMENIIRLFAEGKSSPLAVDSKNRSLMHHAFGASGSGSLIMAVKTKNREQVLYLLTKHPDSIKEQNHFGHNALLVAAYENSLPLFPELLDAAIAADVFNERDNIAISVLQVAVEHTSFHCTNGDDGVECTQCSCSDSVSIVMDKCAELIAFDYQFYLCRRLEAASQRCRRLWLRHLKGQREGLKEFALRHRWALRAVQHVLESTEVLDLHATQVCKLLQQQDIQVPAHLVPHEILQTSENHPSLYCMIDSVDMAEQLFELGFREIDYDQHYGRQPLRTLYIHDPHLSLWFLDHGADPQRLIKLEGKVNGEDRWITTGHEVMLRVGEWMDRYGDSFGISGSHPYFEALSRITATICSAPLTDGCRCVCSPGGCTPFTCYLKGRLRPSATDSLNHYKILQNLTAEEGKSTCYTWDPDRTMDDDEVMEIQDEEHDLIETFKELPAILEEIESERMTEEERREAEMIGVAWVNNEEETRVYYPEAPDPAIWTEDNWEYLLESELRCPGRLNLESTISIPEF